MRIQKLKCLKNDIEDNINEMRFDEAEGLINDYEELNYDNLDNLIYRGIIKFYKQEYKEAEIILNKAVKINPFNFDLNYNLAIVLECSEKYIEALRQYVKSAVLSSEEYKESIEEKINDLVNIICELYKNIEKKHILEVIKKEKNKILFSNALFPYYNESQSYFGEFFKEEYFICKHDKYSELKDNIVIPYGLNTLGFHCAEMIKAKEIDYKKYNDSDIKIVPICTKKKNSPIFIKQNNKTNTVINRLENRFYYYRIEGKAEIKGEGLIIGEPIILKKDSSKKDLVLNIFIDGLSQSFLEEYTLERAMPYTFKYFSEGVICNNAYSVAEWTLPSVASIYSGKYITNHMVYHPNYNTELPKDNKVFAEMFKDLGYLTEKIDGNWRTAPTYGYYRGIDRSLYKRSSREMGVEEIVTEIIENLHSYKETNHFIWTCVFDLHDIADCYDLKMSSCININIDNLDYLKDSTKQKSVRQYYNEDKKNRYLQQLKRVDLYLSLLYNYICENYDDENIVVSLISDHGQSYLIQPGDSLLSDERIKIPMMFRGSRVKKGICDELIESIDFGKIVSKISGFECEEFGTDSNLPVYFGGKEKRKYTYSESIYPGSTYKASINFDEYIGRFETESNVNNDARFNIDNFKLILISKNDKKEFIDKEKYNECLEIVLKHISKLIMY